MESASVQIISDCFVKPKIASEEANKPIYFSPWDLPLFCLNYIQKGLLFRLSENQDFIITTFLKDLKDSLSATLSHFHPLAARFATVKRQNPPSMVVFLNPENSPGARFIHSTVDLRISDVLQPTDVPLIVQSFFDHHEAIAHDGHELSLLSIQVTELIDGIFIGSLRPRMAVRNACPAVTDRSRNLLQFAVNNRSRISPPLPENYFGNLVLTVTGTTTAGELMEQSIGRAAWRLHEAMVNHDDKEIKGFAESWLKKPFVVKMSWFFDPNGVHIGSLPRFDMYGNEFGLGKGVAVLSGYGNKFDGKVTAYPGRDGGGSMDLEICLLPENMAAFESDEEFLSVVN
ncbi:hypothetical protein L6452_33926 [Arctium lappa]|uniref:Uncharacterized protein n=1 Tax=Arctium lappa TaxID=4217 RepID=A0ACB8YHY0_ARCLA|nr:hypothetical protein L6452_33926 [Arctium lappa]